MLAMTSQIRQGISSVSIRGVASLFLSGLAGGALLVVPIPGWGWTALRAFLQF